VKRGALQTGHVMRTLFLCDGAEGVKLGLIPWAVCSPLRFCSVDTCPQDRHPGRRLSAAVC
jgi:hypothetical protein